jgi:hypothetical protein
MFKATLAGAQPHRFQIEGGTLLIAPNGARLTISRDRRPEHIRAMLGLQGTRRRLWAEYTYSQPPKERTP